MDVLTNNEVDFETQFACATDQLAELELLKSMYSEDEIRLDEQETIPQKFVGENADVFNGFSFCLNLQGVGRGEITGAASSLSVHCPYEVTFHLPRSYPRLQHPDVFVRRSGYDTTALNESIRNLLKEMVVGDPMVTEIIGFIKENADHLSKRTDCSRPCSSIRSKTCDVKAEQQLARYWIYSHHLYGTEKRRNLVSIAGDLALNGFSLPGKPGVICVEGDAASCRQFWDTVRRWNWLKLVLRQVEECTTTGDDFIRLQPFREISFTSTNPAAAHSRYHMDMGSFRDYLNERLLSHAFHILFGLDGTNKK